MARKKKLNGTGIHNIFNQLGERLPSTFPQARLVVHPNFLDLFMTGFRGRGAPPFAYCDVKDNTIHVAAKLYREDLEIILWFYLHEMGHLYAFQRYGADDDKFADEKKAEQYADVFANRWFRRLKKEKWFK
jgi:hypothetical protein